MSYHECPVCGKYTLRIWKEKHEAWGRPVYEEMEECLNDRCGYDDESEDDEDE